jgi:adenosyl cobinamide kinase/adenosyl cobinamide phosphate guanylyltransferase
VVFITGGAYQGKEAFAAEKYGVGEDEIRACTEDGEPDWSSRCVTHLERYVWYCVKNGLTPEDRFRDDAVLTGDDIFCGVVPIDVTERAWREETGRFYSRVSSRADKVWRVFCGLPLELK